MRRLWILMALVPAVASGECILDDAKWAYDTEHKILRLCQDAGDGVLKCTAFPEKIEIIRDLSNPFNL